MGKLGFFLMSLVFLPTWANEQTSVDSQLRNQMEELFQASKLVNEPKEQKKARLAIEKAVDWDEIATLCLGKQAAKKNQGKNFSDFRNLLREVVSKTAFSRLDKFWQNGTTATIDKVELNKNTAHVAAKFKSKEDVFSLDYYLNKKGSQWLIYDIAYEDLKYSENIKEQVDVFLKEKSFSDLLGKLRKRAEELDKSKS